MTQLYNNKLKYKMQRSLNNMHDYELRIHAGISVGKRSNWTKDDRKESDFIA